MIAVLLLMFILQSEVNSMISCSSVCVYLTARDRVIIDDSSICRCSSIRAEFDD